MGPSTVLKKSVNVRDRSPKVAAKASKGDTSIGGYVLKCVITALKGLLR